VPQVLDELEGHRWWAALTPIVGQGNKQSLVSADEPLAADLRARYTRMPALAAPSCTLAWPHVTRPEICRDITATSRQVMSGGPGCRCTGRTVSDAATATCGAAAANMTTRIAEDGDEDDNALSLAHATALPQLV
jgi:hypothetical protein